jgi:hypothetical protein
MPGQDGRILTRRIGKLQGDDRKPNKPANPFEPNSHGSIITSFYHNESYLFFVEE